MSKYYINDKERFDALESTKQRITNSSLHELLKARGVICSPHKSREDLIKKLNSFEFMYHDIETLSEKIESTPKKARYTTTTIKNLEGFDEQSLREIYENLKADRSEENKDEIYNFTKKEDGALHLKIDYTDTDLSKTTLKQKQKNSADIFIEIKDNKVTIKTPIKERSKEISSSLSQRIQKKFKNSEQFEISLIDITNPKKRTQFFLDLIKELQGLSFVTVKSVGVESRIYNPLIDDDESTYVSEDEDDSDPEDNKEIASEEIKQIFQASLTGNSVTTTSEYRNLTDNGFFISHMIWEVEEIAARYRLRVGFENPRKSTGFNYDILGKFNRKKSYEFNTTSSKIQDSERREIYNKIEEAALKAYGKAREKLENGND